MPAATTPTNTQQTPQPVEPDVSQLKDAGAWDRSSEASCPGQISAAAIRSTGTAVDNPCPLENNRQQDRSMRARQRPGEVVSTSTVKRNLPEIQDVLQKNE
jgi:hypothetical protein